MGESKWGEYRAKIEQLLINGVKAKAIKAMPEFSKVPITSINYYKHELKKKGAITSRGHVGPSSLISRSSEVQEALDNLVEAIKQSIKKSL